MKTKFHLIAGVAMIAALASCSNDDVISMPDINKANMAIGYAKIAISMPNDGTRAEDYEAGTEKESAITDIVLALYDNQNRYVGKGTLVSESLTKENNSESPNVQDKYSDVFKLEYTDDGVAPTKVIAFINMGKTEPASFSNLDVLTTQSENANIMTTTVCEGQGDQATKFAMTNSGYFANSDYVVAADLTADNIKTTESEATTVAATIYVERLAAKITVDTKTADKTYTTDEEGIEYEIVDTEDNPVTLAFTPQYWGATGTAQEEYLVKTKYTSNAGTDWQGTKRTFWAEGVNYFTDYNLYSTTPNEEGKTAPLSYVTFADVKNFLDNGEKPDCLTEISKSLYVLEHTTMLNITAEHPEYLTANTYALILGSYKIEGANASKYQTAGGQFDFYLLLKGMSEDGKKKTYTIYNEDELKAYLLQYNNLELGSLTKGDENEEVTLADFTLQYDEESGKYVLRIAEGTTIKKGDDVLTNEEDLKESTNSRHYHYQNGMAYFNAKIEHVAGVVGVVRNHSYKLNIDKILSLGAPLDFNGHEGETGEIEPDPIVPDPDDLKNHFIKAEINVLSWHVKTNDVTL